MMKIFFDKFVDDNSEYKVVYYLSKHIDCKPIAEKIYDSMRMSDRLKVIGERDWGHQFEGDYIIFCEEW